MSDPSTALAAPHEEQRTALQLAFEPSSFAELLGMCKVLFASGLLPKAVTRVEAAVYIAIRGRELGLTIGQSFASINVIDGKTVMSADLIVARVKKSPHCKVWRIDVCTNEECTVTAQRVGDEKPTTLTWTIADAKRAGLVGKTNWQNYPRSMLRARVSSELAHALFPEVALGMYDPDEIGPVANDTRPAPAELVGEVVRPAEQEERPAKELAKELAGLMRAADHEAELDACWAAAQKHEFQQSMAEALWRVYGECKAKFAPPKGAA